jgi:hypothetical protein
VLEVALPQREVLCLRVSQRQVAPVEVITFLELITPGQVVAVDRHLTPINLVLVAQVVAQRVALPMDGNQELREPVELMLRHQQHSLAEMLEQTRVVVVAAEHRIPLEEVVAQEL